MGESENYYFLETIAALGLKVGLNIQINKLMKLNEYQRSWPTVTQISKLKLVFSKTFESFGTKFHLKAYG